MSESNSTGNRFHIDLSRSRSPHAFSDKENLWEDDLKRIYRLVERHYNTLRSDKKQDEDWRKERPSKHLPHLAIAIFGPSGSGKSSLLRTLAKDVERQTIVPVNLRKKVYSLPVMDPTTWADSDQFLYAFLASALEEEREVMRKRESGYPQGLSPVQLAFQEVNEYLRVIDEPEKSTEYDPLGLSLQKLERHTSGLRLRDALGNFVKELAQGLKARDSLILLPVDDLDMAPRHLVPALQSYQSFLTHHQLVPVFTFTDRMPEELIEAYYREALGERVDPDVLERENRRLMVSEQLSLQFLSRNFPVRNRIRLGPAPARVQRATFYRSGEGEVGGDENSPVKTLELLTAASFLLFGHPDREDAHAVRAALRPSTLRRQIQVLDAVADCHVIEFQSTSEYCKRLANGKDASDLKPLKGLILAQGEEGGEELRSEMSKTVRKLGALDRDATWATLFNITTWSLLNVHRDTLRELGLHLEDLYSWNPREMRSFVLDKLLGQSRVTRRMVLDRWFNRTDYRRSQILSILAANIFRPWMVGEEPYGDQQAALKRQIDLEDTEGKGLDQRLDSNDDSSETAEDQVDQRLAFSVAKGFLWFVDVTIGFYLPQVLARNWNEALDGDEPVKGRMGGNGWDLHNGPVNAIRVADLKQDHFAFGMMFLDVESYREKLEKVRKEEPEGERGLKDHQHHLLLRMWTYAGYSRGRFWAAVSLWRGLGLIGQLLEMSLGWGSEVFIALDREISRLRPDTSKSKKAPKLEPILEYCKSSKKRYSAAPKQCTQDELRMVRALEEIKGILKSHLISGLVPGSLLAKTNDENRVKKAFPKWRPEVDQLDDSIAVLAFQLACWLVEQNKRHIYPMPVGEVRIDWGECFVRRIHGEYILGALWPRLNSAYLETQEKGGNEAWSAQLCLAEWSNLLMEYWRKANPVLEFLISCPIFLLDPRLFSNEEKYSENEVKPKHKRTKWGSRLGLDKRYIKAMPERLVPEIFDIKRAKLADFKVSPPRSHHVIANPRIEDESKREEEDVVYKKESFSVSIESQQSIDEEE